MASETTTTTRPEDLTAIDCGDGITLRRTRDGAGFVVAVGGVFAGGAWTFAEASRLVETVRMTLAK